MSVGIEMRRVAGQVTIEADLRRQIECAQAKMLSDPVKSVAALWEIPNQAVNKGSNVCLPGLAIIALRIARDSCDNEVVAQALEENYGTPIAIQRRTIDERLQELQGKYLDLGRDTVSGSPIKNRQEIIRVAGMGVRPGAGF